VNGGEREGGGEFEGADEDEGVRLRQVALAALGGLLLVAALAGVGLPVGDLVAALGADYLLVAAIASVGLLVAVALLITGRATRLDQASVPDPERPITAPPPGAGFDEAIADWRLALPWVARSRREAIRTRLREAAIESLRRRSGLGRAEAEARVAAGEWTDDPVAASYLADDRRGVGVGRRLGSLLRGETWTEHRARRAAAAIVRGATEGDR
jgi:hypothetical protein